MADIIHNLSVGGTSRPLGTVHYIEGTGTTAGTWLGSDPSITAYYDGLTIAYKVNIDGASTTTLNINGLGAKTVRRNASNLTTHYPVNSVVHLTYTTISGTSYWQCADYDANSDQKTSTGNTSSKIYLVGGLTQSTSGQTTYTHDTAYVDTDGCLYSGSAKVLTAHQSVTNKAATLAWNTTSTVATVGSTDITVKLPANPNTDTKNTAGSSNTSSKIFLVGATSQASSATTYSHDTAYVGTDGCLYSGGTKVLTSHQSVVNSAPTLAWNTTSTVGTVGGTALTVKLPANPNTDTKNTAGSSNTASKIFLIGSTSQVSSGTTYSQDTAYVGTDGHLYSNSTKVFSESYAPEGYIAWGGKNVSGGVTPIGMSLSEEHSGNKAAFINGNAISVEYSTDGTTYTDAGLSTSDKVALFTTEVNVNIGGNTAMTSSNYSKLKTRITLTAQDGTNQYIYTDVKKLLVNMSTAVTTTMLIETQNGNSTSWSSYGTYNVSGWSGWNDIPLMITLGGSASQKDRPWKLRFTFSLASYSETYSTTKTIQGFRIFGQNSWHVPSTLGKTGHLYSYDIGQNATFPAGLNTVGQLKENGTRVSKVGHSHTVTHTPAGSVTFTGSTATTSAASNSTVASSSHTHTVTSTGDYTPAGTISAPAFTGKAKASGGPSATTSVASSSHTHTVTSTGAYTPAGSVAAPTFTGSAATSGGPSATTSVYSITTLPSLSASIANNCMTFSWTAAARSSVTVPTYNHTHSVTAKGSNSAPAFTGTAATLSVSGTTATPSATATVPTYNHTHSVTASGTIAAPTFTGTAATLSVSGTSGGPSATVSVAAASHKHTVTANGSASFTGTTATITTSASTN